MKIKEIKAAIYEQVKNCDDSELLLDVLVKLIPTPPNTSSSEYAEEPETECEKTSVVPRAHYKLLMKDWSALKKAKSRQNLLRR